MTPEEKSLLERTYKLAEENNGLLVSMRRHSRIQTALKVLYWVIILAIGFGMYYLIQPYVESVTGLLQGDSAGNNIRSESFQSPTSSLLDILSSPR